MWFDKEKRKMKMVPGRRAIYAKRVRNTGPNVRDQHVGHAYILQGKGSKKGIGKKNGLGGVSNGKRQMQLQQGKKKAIQRKHGFQLERGGQKHPNRPTTWERVNGT